MIGSQIIPIEEQSLLHTFKTWGLPLVELFVFSYIFIKIRKATRAYKVQQERQTDFYEILKETCAEIVPTKLVPFLATEIAVFYYGFYKWKKTPLQANEFSVHKNTSTVIVMCVVLFLVGIETFALHLLLNSWHPIFAWILTGLSIYSAFQIIGFMKSILHRSIVIDQRHLKLRFGMMSEMKIDFQDIARVELSNKQLEKSATDRMLSPMGDLEGQNMLITFKKHQELKQLYGFHKSIITVGLHVDNPIALHQALMIKMAEK
ncbi:hypothetical protein DNU06_05055 [Putridiphycobacter roseus]|uniref:Uncharacterized protein n=1 Tax=Putridiphycobacter roseus TaxID=2219161 RepID=A0A2W1N357_9FLAO|nr:hypothetical protein DNU06_05055 [Putridiphycobacter roseus]